jgi:hypothetical protein
MVVVRVRHGCARKLSGMGPSMPKRIVSGLASAVRHAGWWLDWHTRPQPGAGTRELAEAGLSGGR